jgi:3-oxoacyl-[acyl-carrier protein] reductase
MYRTLIIGGSKGLGAEIKKQLETNSPAQVVTLCRHGDVFLDLEWHGETIVQRVRETIRDMGGIDNLIISSGFGIYLNPIGGTEDIRKTIQINQTGPICAFRGALKGLLRSKGKACMITSTCSRRPGSGGLSVYGASKAGLNGFVLNEARRVATKGIALYAISPGWFDGPMVEELHPKIRKAAEKAIPFGRFGTEEEIAQCVVSTLSMSNWCLAGQIWEMSGGL